MDVSCRESFAQLPWGQSMSSNLFRGAENGVGDGFELLDSSDAANDVRQRFEVLDVHCAEHVDAAVEDGVNGLPAFLVCGPGALCGPTRR